MNILDLPAELVGHICSHLDDADCFSARISNRALEQASFTYFGTHFFRKKGFMITSPSLRVLQDIANHQELSKYVQHVWFNPDCYTFNPPDCCPEENGEESNDNDWDGVALSSAKKVKQDPATKRRYDAYRRCQIDRAKLLLSKPRVQTGIEALLTAVLQRLPNLVTVGMRRSEEYSPYGWSMLQEAVGQDPRIIGPITSGPWIYLSETTTLFEAIISALASTRTRLKRLYTDAVELDNIHIEDLPLWKLQAACSSILYLELNIVRGSLIEHPVFKSQLHKTLDSSQSDEFGANLVAMLTAMPSLREIGLQILPDRSDSNRFHDPRQSYSYLTFKRLVTEVRLANLTRIKLQSITTTATILQDFFKPSAANITSLKLRDISLLSSEAEIRPWQDCFNLLATHCPKLDYVLFYHLMRDRGGVSFVEEPPEVMPEESEEYVVGQAVFEKYSHITLEVQGQEAVREKLEEVTELHWYHQPLFSYAMDEDLWHTDTSDEEW